MFRIRPKSFIGLLFGCFLIFLMTWIQFKFDISGEQVFIYTFITLCVLGVLGSLFGEQIIDFVFQSFGDERRKMKFQVQLKKLTDPEEEKRLILKWSRKINFNSYDLRNLIKNTKIEDDEFWISFVLKNIKKIPLNNRDYFYGFLVQLKSKESQEKLKKTLVSKGVLIEDHSIEFKQEILFRVSKKD